MISGLNARSGRIQVVPIAALGLVAAVHLAAWTSWGQTGIWGAHHAAFLPVWCRAALLAGLALAALPNAGPLLGRLLAGAATSRLSRLGGPAAAGLAGLALFAAFPVAHPLFGDSTGRLAEVEAAQAPPLWPPEYANDTLLRYAFHHGIGQHLGWGASASYATLSAAWGGVFLAAAWTLARQLAADGAGRALLFGALASGGYALLFFGYVEVYGSVAALGLVLLACCVTYMRGGVGLWAPLVVLALMGFHHILGLLPAPAVAWAWAVRRGWPERVDRAWRRRLPALIVAGSSAIGWAAYLWVRPTSAVPLAVPYSHIPYTLFDVAHLADVANFHLLAALPGWVALGMAVAVRCRNLRQAEGEKEAGVLWVAAGTTAALLFVVNPALGRLDWDLMSLHAPLWVAAGALTLERASRQGCGGVAPGLALAVTAIGLFHALPWIGLQCLPARAVAAVEAMSATDPHSAGHRAAKLGVRLEDMGFAQAAERQYLRAVAQEPDDYLAHFNLARVLDLRDERQAAIHHYRRAAALDAGFPKTFNNLGGLYHRMGRLDSAQACYAQAARLEPDYAPAYNNLGLVYCDQERWPEAAVAYERAAALAPDMPHVHFNLGTVYSRMGRYDAAARSLEAFVARQPQSAAGFLNLGDACARLGDRRRARAALQRFLELAPAGSPQRARAEAYLHGTEAEGRPPAGGGGEG